MQQPPSTSLWISLGLLAVLIIGSTLGRFHWSGDLLLMFLDYALLLTFALMLFALWRGHNSAAAICFLLVAVGAGMLIRGPRAVAAAGQAPELRIMVFNLRFDNPEREQVAELIEAHDPDLLYLIEYPSQANDLMRLELDQYPYSIVEPSRFTMGVALYSKFPIVDQTLHRFAETRIPIFEVDFDVAGEMVTFVGGHPWPPQPQWGALHRAQLNDVLRVAEGVENERLIVGGDFNTPPTAYMLQQLASRAEVAQVRSRFDLRKTFFPVPVLGLTLDHLFVSDSFGVQSYTYDRDMAGSDHRPLVVDLSFN